jgi:hypothetical protein
VETSGASTGLANVLILAWSKYIFGNSTPGSEIRWRVNRHHDILDKLFRVTHGRGTGQSGMTSLLRMGNQRVNHALFPTLGVCMSLLITGERQVGLRFVLLAQWLVISRGCD